MKITSAHTFYRRLVLGLLRRFLHLPLPIKLGISFVAVSLPAGFYLNEQDSRRLNYFADQMSGLASLGFGLIIAYTLIDTFNERAEEAKYANVRAIGFYHLALEINPFLMETIGVLNQNNPNRQEQLYAGHCAFSLGHFFNNDFSSERQRKLDGLIHELCICADSMNGRSNFTPDEFDEFTSAMEQYIESISSSHVPRLIETRLDIMTHANLIEIDHDLKFLRQTLRQAGIWRDPESAIKNISERMSAEELEDWQPPNLEELRRAGRVTVEIGLIRVVHTLLDLFAISSAQVSRSNFFEVLRQKNAKLHEEYPGLIPKDPFGFDNIGHDA